MNIPCRINPLGASDGLPSGYTQVTYLESSGTQYVDTGVIINNASWVRCRFRVLTGHSFGFVFGARYTANGKAHALYLDSTTTWAQYGNQGSTTAFPKWHFNVDNCLEAKGNVWKINNMTYIFNNEIFSAPGACWLFRLNQTASVDSRMFVGRIYEFSVLNGAEKCFLIPAVTPKGLPCMWDKISRQPLNNAGSGQFTVGIETQDQLNKLLHSLPDYSNEETHVLTIRLGGNLKTEAQDDYIDSMASTKNWNIAYAV